MTAFITTHRESFGVEPICTVLQAAPSKYYDTIGRTPTRRAQHDEVLKVEIRRVHEENHGVYGVDKVWHQLHREGWHVGRDRVTRLMRALGLKGVVRGKRTRTTVSKESDDRPADLVDRKFTASAPNCLWVADITYVSIWSGFAYVAFIIDVFSRRIVGWRVSTSLHAELALDALEMAIWSRQGDDLAGLVHHSYAWN
jgi:putative transposase